MASTSETFDVYRKLQVHLDKMPIGFPPAKSGSDIRVLRYLFTEQQAEIATLLRFGWDRDLELLDTIYERAGGLDLSKAELETALDEMGHKGLIMTKIESGQKYYGNALLMVGIFEFQVNRLKKEFIKDLEAYIDEAWLLEAVKVKGAQLRTIPIEQGIDINQNVSNFDELQKLLETTDGPYMIANCICRQLKDMEGQPCKVTKRREVCMGFGYAARLYIDQGWGREISKEDAIEILRQNQEEGLVLQPDNSQKLTFLCSCCSCCCGMLSRYLKFPNPADAIITNYYAQIDSDICTGCGICVEICPMEAIKLVDNVSLIKKKRCIGCGNCVAKCPSEAIKLFKKEKEFIPFPTMDALFDKIMQRKIRLTEKK
jgi:electron transport complex protein RnfB